MGLHPPDPGAGPEKPVGRPASRAGMPRRSAPPMGWPTSTTDPSLRGKGEERLQGGEGGQGDHQRQDDQSREGAQVRRPAKAARRPRRPRPVRGKTTPEGQGDRTRKVTEPAKVTKAAKAGKTAKAAKTTKAAKASKRARRQGQGDGQGGEIEQGPKPAKAGKRGCDRHVGKDDQGHPGRQRPATGTRSVGAGAQRADDVPHLRSRPPDREPFRGNRSVLHLPRGPRGHRRHAGPHPAGRPWATHPRTRRGTCSPKGRPASSSWCRWTPPGAGPPSSSPGSEPS